MTALPLALDLSARSRYHLPAVEMTHRRFVMELVWERPVKPPPRDAPVEQVSVYVATQGGEEHGGTVALGEQVRAGKRIQGGMRGPRALEG